MSFQYDIVVIGAGPGGYETAIKAAQVGKKVCVIEAGNLGGTCLNVGCIPTKALIRSASLYSEIKSAAAFGINGIEADKVTVDLSKMQARKKQVVNQLVSGVGYLLKGNGVTVVKGLASFVDPHTLKVGEELITAENVIIATGSSVLIPGFIKQEGTNNIIDSTMALEISELPESMVIIGGGVIGIEFANLFQLLGCKITVVELMDTILPMVDREVAELARKRLARIGVKFQLGAKVEVIRDNEVFYSVGEEHLSVKADAIFMAVGRKPNVEGLNAEGIGLAFDRRAIATDEHMRTNIPNIYAIGDVNGKVMLAHVASHEGMVAVDNICGGDSVMRYDCIPSCIYVDPEIACVGLTEAKARETYGDVKIGKFPLMGNGKSLVEGETSGMFKVIIAADTGKILGVHLYGKHTTDMIAEATLAMTQGITADEFLHTIHPHPTVSEAMGEAMMSANYGKAINSL